MRLWVLGSGSAGNATLLESNGTRVLIDAGFPPRVLATRLSQLGVACESIEAVVLTHEHHDHVRGACMSAARWGWSLHATHGTIAALPELATCGARAFRAGDELSLGDFALRTHVVSHDAAEPVAVIATARWSGTRAGIAYDLGRATGSLREQLCDLDLLVVETNHDVQRLRSGPYPAVVQQRIAGNKGHLSNEAGADLAAEMAHRGLAHVILAHLSRRCNEPALALRAVRQALRRTRFQGSIHAASQDRPCGPFHAGGHPGTQLSLAL